MATPGFPPRPISERFFEKVIPVPEAGCWLWTGAVDPKGYGRFLNTATRRSVLAHRTSWELLRGPIPDGMFVCHKCDTPGCCNPDHLFLGTPSDNNADMTRKGRRNQPMPVTQRGERHYAARLSEDDVRAIRSSSGNQRVVAARFGIERSLVSMIRSGKRWKHVA